MCNIVSNIVYNIVCKIVSNIVLYIVYNIVFNIVFSIDSFDCPLAIHKLYSISTCIRGFYNCPHEIDLMREPETWKMLTQSL